jgi:glycosyltransferase involved in cell wall biosynthesis
MLGLAEALSESVHTTFISFPEDGQCAAFLDEVRQRGFPARSLMNDFPRVRATLHELTSFLRATACEVLLCHGYKAHLLGRLAARRVGIPAVAVSRGWTGETRKVKLYEWLDRRHLRLMDHVVCVSDGQAEKVRRWCRVPATRLSVIRNSARLAAFEKSNPAARDQLRAFFPSASGVSRFVVAAGRLSPEKGFSVLIDAAATIAREHPDAGVILFGEGALRETLEAQIAKRGLTHRVVLPGFRQNLDSLISAADVVVLPSFTEGLPNIALEASAAGVPLVATAVGGTPEVVAAGETGFLVPPGHAEPIAARVGELLRDSTLRARMGAAGRARMRELFTFEAQAQAYLRLFRSLCSTPIDVAA